MVVVVAVVFFSAKSSQLLVGIQANSLKTFGTFSQAEGLCVRKVDSYLGSKLKCELIMKKLIIVVVRDWSTHFCELSVIKNSILV